MQDRCKKICKALATTLSASLKLAIQAAPTGRLGIYLLPTPGLRPGLTSCRPYRAAVREVPGVDREAGATVGREARAVLLLL